MTAQTPVYGIKYPVIGEPIRTTRQILEDNAKAVEAALLSGGVAAPGATDLLALAGRVNVIEAAWTSYAPSWTCTGSAPVLGNGTLVGRYRKVGRTVDLSLFLSFGSSTTGGTGGFAFTLPFPAVAGREQLLSVKYNVASFGNLFGFGLIVSGGTTVQPYTPTSTSNGQQQQAQNRDATVVAGTGYPRVPSADPFVPGANIVLGGRYEAAA